jgi:ribosomal protein S18 acetylase RimI-like enzyme
MAAGRFATPDDLPAMTETLTRAFADDPVWGGWAFPDREHAAQHRSIFLGLWLQMSLRYRWVRVTQRCEAVASWFPPGTGEDSPADQEELVRLAEAHLGGHAPMFLAGQEIIENSQPKDPPHYYLSMLGTHDAHRGKGLGAALLRESLGLIDEERMPAYLESTNAHNRPLYERLGFRKIGEYRLPQGPSLDTMWRDPLGRGDVSPGRAG